MSLSQTILTVALFFVSTGDGSTILIFTYMVAYDAIIYSSIHGMAVLFTFLY